jgi:hypothetical protein
MAKGLFGSIVGRLHAVHVKDRPQALVVRLEFFAAVVLARVAVAAQQETVNVLADRSHPLAKGAARPGVIEREPKVLVVVAHPCEPKC